VRPVYQAERTVFSLIYLHSLHISHSMDWFILHSSSTVIVIIVFVFSYREFEANVIILHHSTTICCGYQPVVHCGVLRQSAEMIEIKGRENLKTGESKKNFMTLLICFAFWGLSFAFRLPLIDLDDNISFYSAIRSDSEVPLPLFRGLFITRIHIFISRGESERSYHFIYNLYLSHLTLFCSAAKRLCMPQ
jgi:hypothetical protein